MSDVWVDAPDALDFDEAYAGRVRHVPLPSAQYDLMQEIEDLLSATSLDSSEWPEPSTLGSAWTPVPRLELPEHDSASESELDEDDTFDPERTPRPPQKDAMMKPLHYTEHEKTPPSLWTDEFPSFPPPPLRVGQVDAAHKRLNETYFGSEDDEDLFSDASSSPLTSPTHSRNGSLESNAFRWSSSTTSTVLTMPSRSHTLDSFMIEEESEEDARREAYLAEQGGRRRSSDTRRNSAELARRPRVAPPMLRAQTDPPRRSKEPEWNTLIDALFGIEPRPAPRAPVWLERELPPIPTLEEKAKLRKKPSTASIVSARSLNGAVPLVGKRTTSLKKSSRSPSSKFSP